MSKIIRIDTLHTGNRHNCSSNGDGFRIVLWVLGCDIKCPGCHNEQYWSFDNPDFPDFSDEHVQLITQEMTNHPKIYSGLSILGGEPFSIFNIDDVLTLCEKFKHDFPDKNIWIWSGHSIEWLEDRIGEYGNKIEKVLELCDILVDGPFDINKRNISLKFRGSENQRIIDLKTREIIS